MNVYQISSWKYRIITWRLEYYYLPSRTNHNIRFVSYPSFSSAREDISEPDRVASLLQVS